jgi:SNF2 family DNA or RNA helicase
MHNVVISEKHKRVMLPYEQRAAAIFHNAKEVDWQKAKWLAIPHGLEETKLLNNMGYEIPNPILSYYDWSGVTPFDTQKSTAVMLVSNPRGYVLNSIGTGKTCSALFAFDYLKSLGLVKKALVVAPLSTLTSVWEKEVFSRFSHLESIALFGTKAKRLKLLDVDSDVYIINHDGVGTIQKELAEKDFDVVIIDELALYRNASTRRWKMLKPIVDKAKYAWGLTGAPTPNEPTDAWGQVRLLTPDRVSYARRRFQQQVMRQVSTFRWVQRPEANDIVYEAMQPAVRFTRDDSFDMPPTTYGYRDSAMEAEQKKLYKNMLDNFAVEVRQKQVTAANEGVKVSKLLQIASGFIYSSDGKQKIIKSLPRFKLLIQLIEEANAKVIVFTPFKFSVNMLGTVLGNYYDVECVNGDTPKAERDRVFNAFQTSKKPEVIVAHPACMAHGLTLTKADTVVWFAPVWSTEIYEQACGRITRAGQNKHTHILHIVGSPIEEKIYKRLAAKQKCQGILLDMFKEGT